MNTEEQLAKIYGELEDMIDVQVYSHELRDDLIDASKAVRKARETAYRVLTKGQKDKYGMTIGSSKKSIKSSVRDDFANRLSKLMKNYSLSFSSGSLEDNMIDIYDNYVSQYYDNELKQKGGAEVANDWFHNTYPDDEEGIFIQNSRKSIKSTFGGNAVFEIIDDKLMDARRNIRSCISINPKKELDSELQNIDELIGNALTHTEMVKNGDYDDYMSPINNSHKPIKSSLEDRLVPYLEEFEEGYANAITRDSEDADEFNHVYEDTFFEQFKSDYNLTDTDIQKLDRAVREIWDASSAEEDEIRDMGEMYGVPRGATSEEALKHFE